MSNCKNRENRYKTLSLNPKYISATIVNFEPIFSSQSKICFHEIDIKWGA